MSTSPVTIGPNAHRTEALALMRAKKIHHMPVCDGGRVVGLVTDGDLADDSGAKSNVKDLMRLKPFTVSPEALVEEVVRQMITQQYGSAAVVVDNGRVVGMFTATDGLRAFADYLRTSR
jgi:CBS domain-containing protein